MAVDEDTIRRGPWTLFFPSGGKMAIDTMALKGMVTDVASWLSIMEMIATGRAATVTIKRDGPNAPIETCKVLSTRYVIPEATFGNPRPDLT